MKNWVTALAVGAVVTYLIHRSKPAWTWISAGIAVLIAAYLWKKEG